MPTDFKEHDAPRIVEPAFLRAALIRYPECAACGDPAANAHHVIPKGYRPPGDDLIQNIVGLCGTGTSKCHGAFHGNPYVVRTPVGTGGSMWMERRTSEWVKERIGEHLLAERPDVIEYVESRLGDAAWYFLGRYYYLSKEDAT